MLVKSNEVHVISVFQRHEACWYTSSTPIEHKYTTRAVRYPNLHQQYCLHLHLPRLINPNCYSNSNQQQCAPQTYAYCKYSSSSCHQNVEIILRQSTASPSHFGGIKPVRTHYPHKSNTLQLQSVTLIYSAPREREEYSIQESDERMKKSAIQQALVCARQLLDHHHHDCAPSSSEFRSELLGKLLSSLLHQSVEIKG